MTRPLNLLWLQAGGCGGCTLSLLGAETPDLVQALDNMGIHLLWHPALSEASGDAVISLLQACVAGAQPLDLLCVEGALLTGPQGTGRFQLLGGSGRPMMEWVEALARRARHVLAVGTCAAFGGMSAAGENLTGALGLQYQGALCGGLLGADFRAGSGLPVINVAGCPTHPGWVLDTLLALCLQRLEPAQLDALQRPGLYADHLVHHGCPRNEFYEFKASAEKNGDLGCLMENLGCQGTRAHADCNQRLWNGSGSCVRGGFACIDCTAPGFEAPAHPFAQTPKVAGIPTGLPSDMPKAWFVALAALSKSATPRRVRENAHQHYLAIKPAVRSKGKE